MGLLDSLQDPSNSLALSLLAAGSPTTDPNASGFGVRLNGAVQQATDKTLKQQAAAASLFAAKQKAALLALGIQGLGGQAPVDPSAPVGPGSVIAAAPSQAAGSGAGPGAALAAPSDVPGGMGGTPVAPAPAAPAAAPGVQPGLLGSGQRAINAATALKLGGEADVLPNIMAGQPKWEMKDGVLWDMNPITNPSMTPRGFALSKSTSADGKSIINLADGSTVVAPGAVQAFGAFEDRKNQSQAANTESRQQRLMPNGRLGPQSVAQAIASSDMPPSPMAGGVPAATPAPVIGAQPPVMAPPRAGGNFSSPGLAGGSAVAAAQGQREILMAEVPKAQAALVAAQQTGDTAAAARAQQDLAGLHRELARLPGGAAPGPMIGGGRGVVQPSAAPAPMIGLPPPSPIVANSGGAAAQAATGIGLPGGSGFSPAEVAQQQAGAAALKETATEQAKQQTVPTGKTMGDSYSRLQSAQSSAGAVLDALAKMREIAARKNSILTVGPLGTNQQAINPDAAEYEKARANVISQIASGAGDKNTDANKALIEQAVPDFGKPKSAIEDGLKTQHSQIVAQQLKAQLLTPVFNSGDSKTYTTLENEFDKHISPAIVPILTMPGGPAKAEAIKEARKQPGMEARLQWAAEHGLLK